MITSEGQLLLQRPNIVGVCQDTPGYEDAHCYSGVSWRAVRPETATLKVASHLNPPQFGLC